MRIGVIIGTIIMVGFLVFLSNWFDKQCIEGGGQLIVRMDMFNSCLTAQGKE